MDFSTLTRTQDQRLADFALSVLKHLQATDWWTDEHWWDLSDLGLAHGVFADRLPTQDELVDYDLDENIRVLTPWVLDRLSDDGLKPYDNSGLGECFYGTFSPPQQLVEENEADICWEAIPV